MSEFTLHCFTESGNAYKAALMLELSGCDWSPKFIPFFEGATRDPAWRESVNEMGEAPVLEHRGRRFTQSGVILDYLAETTGRYAAGNDDETREIWRWILFDNHKFTSYYATLRFLYGLQNSGETPVTEFLRARARAAYAVVDKHLAKADFLVGAARPSPTFRSPAISSTRRRPASTGRPNSRMSRPSRSGSPRCPAGRRRPT
ncbi:hypothetical protein A6302_00562 [Methylobrevis pamukkalensis]|uniref:GST N-terminal domain-containing protein n=1 Tax=Methylobrevis pamukkalensis TaxID=1439726 RepID=A0A1E3H6T8_9HYPH|nr:hypothetical protein A6302_00562 [Methylobrevis pamukkalensis]